MEWLHVRVVRGSQKALVKKNRIKSLKLLLLLYTTPRSRRSYGRQLIQDDDEVTVKSTVELVDTRYGGTVLGMMTGWGQLTAVGCACAFCLQR